MNDVPPTFGPREVHLQEVIIVRFIRGKGVEGDPVRPVVQVWSKAGSYIAEDDPTASATSAQGGES